MLSTAYLARTVTMPDLRPEQVCILQDSREQDPLPLDPFPIKIVGLRTGDYQLAAAPGWACIERKSAGDLLGCCGKGRERFEAELERIRAFPRRMVLVEAPLDAMLMNQRTRLTEAHILGTLSAWQGRYCGFFFAGNRATAADVAKRFLYCAARELWRHSEAFRKEAENVST